MNDNVIYTVRKEVPEEFRVQRRIEMLDWAWESTHLDRAEAMQAANELANRFPGEIFRVVKVEAIEGISR